jgi:hypothetical protein
MTNYITLEEYCKTDQFLEAEALKIAQKLGTFTADDLHSLDLVVKALRRDKRVYGALLKSLHKKGKIQPVKYVVSKRETCHARPIMQWRTTQ